MWGDLERDLERRLRPRRVRQQRDSGPRARLRHRETELGADGRGGVSRPAAPTPDQQRRVVFVDKQRGHSQSLSEDASNIHSSDTTPNVFATDTARLIAVYADSPHTLEQAAQDLLARAPATSAKLSRQDKRRLRTVDGAVAALQASRGAATAWHTQAAVYALKYQMSRAPGVVKCTMTNSDM